MATNLPDLSQYEIKPTAQKGGSSLPNLSQYEVKPAVSHATPEPSFLDRLTAPTNPALENFRQAHPYLSAPLRFFDAAGAAGMALPGQVYHAATDPITQQEQQEFQGHTRIPGELTVERLTGAPLVRGAQQYADPATRPTWQQAKSVLPEALGQGVGTVAGSELYPAATKAVVGKTVPPAIRATGEALSKVTPRAVSTGVGTILGGSGGSRLGFEEGLLGGGGGAYLGNKVGGLLPNADVPFSETHPWVNNVTTRMRMVGDPTLLSPEGARMPGKPGAETSPEVMNGMKVALPGGKTQTLGDFLGVPKDKAPATKWVKSETGNWVEQPNGEPTPFERAKGSMRAGSTDVSAPISTKEWNAAGGNEPLPQAKAAVPPPIDTQGTTVHPAVSPRELAAANWLNDNKARLMGNEPTTPQDFMTRNLPPVKAIPEVSRPLPQLLGGDAPNPNWLLPTKDTWTNSSFGRAWGLDKMPTTESVWGDIEPPNAWNNWRGIGPPSAESNTVGRSLSHEFKVPAETVDRLAQEPKEPANLMAATAKPKGAPGFSGHRLGEDNVPRISEIRGGDQVANALMNAKNNQFIDVAKEHLGEDVKPEDLTRSRAQHGDNLNPAKAALIGRILDRLTPAQIVEAFGGKWTEPKD